MEAVCKTGEECSRVKSSAKVGVPTSGVLGLISEELTPPVCLNGLNEFRLLLRFTDDRFFATHFFWRIIAAPFVGCVLERCSHGARLGKFQVQRIRIFTPGSSFIAKIRTKATADPSTTVAAATFAQDDKSVRFDD
jgi:hypothetical protein